MSISAAEENHELMKVLNRINTLMGQPEQQIPVSDEDDIPQLTELYEGEPLAFVARSAEEFPPLQEVESHIMADPELPVPTEIPQAEVVEALLAEMMPVIQGIIKNAVLQEMENSEEALCAKLEIEIMQSLRENLQSRLS
jgi:hypothetical protein